MGTFGVQNEKKYTFVKSLYPLKCLASPDLPFLNGSRFPLCSYKEFGVNSKFWCFKRKMPLQELKIRTTF
ncbi:hypothetical protein DQV24_14660 [Staphylococcus aureus]|nr:hypothetical protein HMPREF0789_0034 [Staphylococcus epidermidis BCM-HMP0060]MBD6787191.1 hypothetical protein [Staphylococcus aureus]PZQ04252.1 MAG: hypothetical protein DI572_02195 [Staphylococcus epidermidis]MBG1197967.1 hypothetical protein [Staphylococcus aureus]PNN71417.1 hypothetical protein RK96_008195 [Staphylococcus aureus]